MLLARHRGHRIGEERVVRPGRKEDPAALLPLRTVRVAKQDLRDQQMMGIDAGGSFDVRAGFGWLSQRGQRGASQQQRNRLAIADQP